jgi:hypothetical protein
MRVQDIDARRLHARDRLRGQRDYGAGNTELVDPGRRRVGSPKVVAVPPSPRREHFARRWENAAIPGVSEWQNTAASAKTT